MEKPSTSTDFTHQIETADTEARPRSSEGDRPRTTTSRTMSQASTEPHFRASGPDLTDKEPDNTLPTFSGLEMEAILGPYACIPTPPEGSGGGIGLDFNPHLPPWPVTANKREESPIEAAELPLLPDTPLASPQLNIAYRRSPSPLVMAVDAAADGLEELSRLPDPTLGLSQFELGSRPSFDTSVRDLIQSRPDSPIGGQEAVPIAIKPKRSFNVRTLVIAQARPLTRTDVSCHDSEPCGEDDMNKPRKARSAVSESQDSTDTRIENRPPRSAMVHQTSDTSPPMITAPESPRSHSRTDGSDLDGPTIHYQAGGSDTDGVGLVVTDFRDFALTSDGSRSKKTSKVPDADPGPVQKGVPDPDFCEDCVSPRSNAPKQAPTEVPSGLDGQAFSGLRGPAIDSVGKTIPPPAVPKDAGKKNVTGKKDASGKGDAGLPVDVTGASPAPGTPKPKKRQRLLIKGHVAIRKCRGVVFRTPVLAMVVGRQLAPTCSLGLKMISKGVPFELPKIVPAAVPAPIPV